MSEFSTLSRPVAAKAYRCMECGRPIQRGERHAKLTGVSDCYMQPGPRRGKSPYVFLSWRYHEACSPGRPAEPHERTTSDE